MLHTEAEDEQLIEEWLTARKGSKVTVVTPQKGKKEKLVELALQNARIVLEQDADRIKKDEQATVGAVRNLGQLIGIEAPERIEAYDISNISGYNMVGSMVVYENGKPKRSDYRKFRIKSLSGQNDYAAMDEVLTRRFSHGLSEMENGAAKEFDSFTRFPDLILMDGGKGQVHIALEVLKELGLNIPVAGMVKDDHHRTRGLYYQGVEIPVDTHSEGFRLITRIQDEAHRFAIDYHRSLRGKAQIHSVLDDIPGIGPVRRRALMEAFGDIEKIRAAGTEELMAAEGIRAPEAEAVYRFFHPQEEAAAAPAGDPEA